MSKKYYNTSSIQNELAGASLFFQKKDTPQPETKPTSKVTRKSTRPRETSRGHAREPSRDKPRGNPRSKSREPKHLPTRDEIQEFSFKLRDEVKVKVQSEVPPAWQQELDNLAHQLGVKKLELYRFIIGEFLGKVTRKQDS